MRKLLQSSALAAVLAVSTSISISISISPAVEAAQPGKGVTVNPMGVGRPDHQIMYEALFVNLGKLGYEIGEMQIGTYPIIHLSLGQGDADWTALHWDPLHLAYYDKSGDDDTSQRLGPMYTDAVQGYFVDKKTVDKHGITNIKQMEDPAIRKLFDSDGDGKANLTGCNPGWGRERVIEHHMDAYKMRDTVNHDKGQYFALMADTIARFKEGKPIFYYTWMPNWIIAVLRPGTDVTQLSVPFTALPGELAEKDTSLADGSNPGFVANRNYVLANKEWAAKNPAAAKFFELFRFPIDELATAMLRMYKEGKKLAKLKEIAGDWVKANQAAYDGWVAEAVKAGGYRHNGCAGGQLSPRCERLPANVIKPSFAYISDAKRKINSLRS
jgi:glycine betaine/proline transport system substrate-binding protein